MDECKPLPSMAAAASGVMTASRAAVAVRATAQGLTLVHFSSQRKHFLWDRGCN